MLKKSATPTYLLALVASWPALAATDKAATDDLDEVQITGSRILRPSDELPHPIMSIDAASIENSGRTNLTDLLVQTPSLVSSTTNYDSAGSQSVGFGDTGINELNLRNLGTQRTLVLVNGHRHVAGMPGEAAVDINTIPLALIDRVDVLTGGVSAIYGADGVSGVVNFVTKRNFQGLAVRAQAGRSARGDGDNYFFSMTGGQNFFDNKGNVALSYEYNADKRISTFDRKRTGDPLGYYLLASNPNDPNDDPQLYDRVLLNDLRYADSSRDGAFDTDWDFVPDFTGHGTAYNHGTQLPTGGLTQGGSSTPIAGYQGDMQPKTGRHSFNVLGNLELSQALRLFGEAKYVRTNNYSLRQPSYDVFTYVSAENPYMPSVIRSAIVPGAASSFGLADGVLMTRDDFDLGVRGESATRETLRSVVGLDGALNDSTRYEASYTYGQTAAHFLKLDYRVKDRYFAALDAVDEGKFLHGVANGHIVCRIDLQPAGSLIDPANYGEAAQTFTPGTNSGCVPLNFFGENLVNPAAQQFATQDIRNRSKVSQHVVSGSITGDFGKALALQGGPTRYAAGAEYRQEKSSSVPDQLIQDGMLNDFSRISPEYGKFNVKEVFAEVNVPVLKDAPLAKTLAFGAAVRWSDYSTVGKTTTWKVDGRWAPVQDIMFRGTYSQAVRAPNITELFAPSSGGYEFIDDPCDKTLVHDGTQYRVANCTALLGTLGINATNFNPEADPANVSNIPGLATGNPSLQEEKARTWTAGFVLQPHAVPGLSINLDWYSIRLNNAINTASAQKFAELCVDQPTLTNVYCSAITRNSQSGYITGWTARPENVAFFTTKGTDLTADYRFDTSVGKFNLVVSGGYLQQLEFIATPGADLDNQRELQNAPKWLATTDLTWHRDGWSVNYGINYFNKTRRFTAQQIAANPDISDPRYFFYKAKWEHDVRAGFTPAASHYELYAGINNLYDRQPDPGSRNYPVSFMGRYFYAGVSLKLDRQP